MRAAKLSPALCFQRLNSITKHAFPPELRDTDNIRACITATRSLKEKSLKKLFRAGALATVALATVALTACNTDSPAPEPAATDDASDRVALAQEEGQLTWYTGTLPDAAAAVAEAFHEDYGIEVTVVRLTSSQIAQRFQAEVDSSAVEADVINTVDATFFQDMAAAGAFRELTEEEFGDVSEDLRLGDAAVEFTSVPMAIPYNSDALGKDAIQEWDDLLDPQLQGKMILADPRGSQAWAQFWTMALNHPELGESFLSAISEQQPQLVDSGASGPELLAAGEYDILIAGVVSSIDSLVDAGAPLENWVPSNPGFAIPNYVSIPTEAPRPNAASLFVSWLTTEAGSQAYNEAQLAISPLGNLPGTFPAPEGLEPVPSPEQMEKDLPRILELLGIS